MKSNKIKLNESKDSKKLVLHYAKTLAQYANLLEDLNIEKSKYKFLAKDLEKFKLALDNISDNIIITDPKANVIYVNKAVEKTTGYKPKEVIGKKSGTLWKTPMPLAYYQKLWDIIKKQKKVFNGEVQNKRKNGEVYTAIISISPVFNEKGEIEFFVSVERDITKEKEIDRSKSEFISLASHQLKTPPTAIKLLTERLLSDKIGTLTEKQKEYFNDIRSLNQRMIDLINTLLNMSRIELGLFSFQIDKKDACMIMQDVVKELELIIKEKQLKFKMTFQKSM